MAPLGAISFLFYNQADPALNLKKKAVNTHLSTCFLDNRG